jgi:hypothetical protein
MEDIVIIRHRIAVPVAQKKTGEIAAHIFPVTQLQGKRYLTIRAHRAKFEMKIQKV